LRVYATVYIEEVEITLEGVVEQPKPRELVDAKISNELDDRVTNVNQMFQENKSSHI
jgi:hypothetical protein